MNDKLTPSDQEERFFQEAEQEQRRRHRQHKQLEAIRQRERAGIANVLQSSQVVADEALALGFDAETAAVLPLVPIIAMAWADGSVSIAEQREVLHIAHGLGIKEHTPAGDFLRALLNEEPSDIFFERVDAVVGHMIAEHADGWNGGDIVALARKVATASGGFFGLTPSIGKEEAELLEQFATKFAVHGKLAPQRANPSSDH